MNQPTPAYGAPGYYPPPGYYGPDYYGPPVYYGPAFRFYFGPARAGIVVGDSVRCPPFRVSFAAEHPKGWTKSKMRTAAALVIRIAKQLHRVKHGRCCAELPQMRLHLREAADIA